MCFVKMFQWEQSENVLANTKKIKQYIKSEQVGTASKYDRLLFERCLLGHKKRIQPIWMQKAHKE